MVCPTYGSVFRFRRFSLELDLAVETAVWDCFIGNWDFWSSDDEEEQHGYEQSAGYDYGFEPGGDSD